MTERSGLHRQRPGAEDIRPASGEPAVPIGDDIWMSPGVSNSYAVGTEAGRVVINAGLNFEGPLHRRAFDAVSPRTTEAIVLTQSHPDHVGGVPALRDPSTEIVMQADHERWRTEHELLAGYRTRNAAFAWGHMSKAVATHLPSLPTELRSSTFPTPSIVVDDHLELVVGGRALQLWSTPGGETTDAMVVWLPDDRTLFTGNLFGPLFGHVPNLVTIRGDRYRDALEYVDAADLVLDLRPRVLVTGHFEPIEGEERIQAEVTALRDATQHVHDRVVEGMEAGLDVHTLMRDVRVPEHLDVGEAYGRTAWNVRAIWELHAGWFHHRSTTELYGVPSSAVFADIVDAAGADALVRAAAAHEHAGNHVEAIHLLDIVLSTEPMHGAARDLAVAAHAQLLAEAGNFWERAWLRHSIERLGGRA